MIYLYLPAKSICNLVLISFDVPDLEVKLIDRGQLYSLSGVQIWLVKQIPQPNVITHQYKPPAKKMVFPRLQSMYDRYELKIMCHVVLLMLA